MIKRMDDNKQTKTRRKREPTASVEAGSRASSGSAKRRTVKEKPVKEKIAKEKPVQKKPERKIRQVRQPKSEIVEPEITITAQESVQEPNNVKDVVGVSKSRYTVSPVKIKGMFDGDVLTGSYNENDSKLGYIKMIMSLSTGDERDEDLAPFVTRQSALLQDNSIQLESVPEQTVAEPEAYYEEDIQNSIVVDEEPIEQSKQEDVEQSYSNEFRMGASRFRDDTTATELEIL